MTFSALCDVADKQQGTAPAKPCIDTLAAMHEIDRRVGQALEQARLSRGLERHELAQRCNVSALEIARYERGGSRPPAKTLFAISAALGTSIAEIFRVAA